MKKILAIILAVSVVLAMAACAKKEEPVPEAPASAVEALAEDAALGEIIMAHFTDKVNSGEYKTLEDLGNALCTGDHIPFAAAGMPVEEGYLNGFSEEISGFTDGYMFGPMIGAIPFVGYVFTVEDQTKTDEFMNTLNEKADLCWNICTAADEKYSAAVGNTVCFVMCPLSLEEE